MSYASYKFTKAILSLEEAHFQKKEWLASSYVYHLVHLQDDDIPPELREEFREVRMELTKVRAQGADCSLQATVQNMDDAEVSRTVDRIVNMYNIIKNYEDLP
jgi:hypothetical protein